LDLRPCHASGELTVAGVLSGTSADGIDVALVRFDPVDGDVGPARCQAFRVVPFEDELAARVRAALDGRPLGLRDTALLHRDLGLAFGRAARKVAESSGARLDLVASHGQTVWHHDGDPSCGPATLQLGDGDFVAEAAGCAVASDFRQRDVAAGGEGAPLSALADDRIFADLPRPSAVLNLGGMANVTVLTGAGAELAWDSGPAGSLLDGLARRLIGRPFDDGGARARGGSASEELRDELLRHPFFDRAPPKSTGRDTFGEPWVDEVVARGRALGVERGEDLLATGVEVVAAHVAGGLERHAPEGLRWIAVCGGGVHNATLLDALARCSPLPVASTGDFGVDPDAREALVFAILGARCALGIASSRARVTAALPGRILGKLSQSPLAPPPAPVEGERLGST
jgi:anhydro-N-acetylmuramic acid kinase